LLSSLLMIFKQKGLCYVKGFFDKIEANKNILHFFTYADYCSSMRFNFLMIFVFKFTYPRGMLVVYSLTQNPHFHSSPIFHFDYLPGGILNPFYILVKFFQG
jgi:hypothetical protein